MAIKLEKHATLRLEALDQILDLTVEEFDGRVRRLVREFRRADIRVDIPATSAAGRVRRVTSTRQYEAEIARLPQMDRGTEFRMAKRHEFLKLRAEEAFVHAGFDAANVAELLRRGTLDLLEPPRPDRAPYLRRAHDELSRLRNLFLEGGLHLVLTTAYRYRSLGVDLQDLIQEGNASLFQAIDGFDWRRDVRFRTYAQFWVHQAVLKSLYNSSRTVRIPVWVQKTLRKAQRLEEGSAVQLSREEIAGQLGMPVARLEQLMNLRRRSISLDAPMLGAGETSMSQQLPDPNQQTFDGGEEINLGERLAEEMKHLPERESAILSRRYGLAGQPAETLGTIAADLGISAERVRQLQNAALQRLQNSGARSRLAGFGES